MTYPILIQENFLIDDDFALATQTIKLNEAETILSQDLEKMDEHYNYRKKT